MVRHGSVAVIILFLVGILFGVENEILVFPIVLTSTIISRSNFYVKIMSKVFKIIVLDLFIVMVAYISSLNLYIGIPVNFIPYRHIEKNKKL